MSVLPTTETLKLDRHGFILHLTLNRPDSRNAMNARMVQELDATFDAISDDRTIRAVVLRGAGGSFCAGGDLKDMASLKGGWTEADGAADPVAARNRAFGALCRKVEASPQVVIAVVEGAAMGGGFGLVCVSDIAIAHVSARFGMPEATMGILPAQIAPFVVRRIGLTEARRLAVTAERIDGAAARELGLVHHLCPDEAAIAATLRQTLERVGQTAPEAIAMTKKLLLAVGERPLDEVLDMAAAAFSRALQGAEGREGTAAFVAKRKPAWSTGLE